MSLNVIGFVIVTLGNNNLITWMTKLSYKIYLIGREVKLKKISDNDGKWWHFI
jgi:hypothetical protein